MKKLTAGIFATLLAVVSAGDANAKIASQAYVDQEVGAVEATVTEVQQNVTNVTEQVTQVTEQVTEITNPDTGLAAVVGDAESGLVKDVADLGTEVDGQNLWQQRPRKSLVQSMKSKVVLIPPKVKLMRCRQLLQARQISLH